ncbi:MULTISPECIES: hypothetical protein [Ralstonia]|jgi:hypothetical protein|uniref:Uncharacterized protein n=2 Tax=Ralstonia pickettii TaxID=329 RepID=R0CMW1_RALPI|nr:MULTISPECIES: hypothetical protein [Ralstonia]ENZ78001.1 hypothetical protein OR214_02277 [Ralstonia pickettii OR214]MCM3581910.1 hypothetical protein [Ralstonia pickettii]
MSHLQSVEDLSSSIRGIFERVLAVEKIAGTAGTCLYGSILLQQALDRFADCETVVRGGDGAGDGGAQDRTGAWHGHYWVEGLTQDGKPFLADITADQFGWPPVVVLPLEEGRERYQPGDDTVCGRAVENELVRMLGSHGELGEGCAQ